MELTYLEKVKVRRLIQTIKDQLARIVLLCGWESYDLVGTIERHLSCMSIDRVWNPISGYTVVKEGSRVTVTVVFYKQTSAIYTISLNSEPDVGNDWLKEGF